MFENIVGQNGNWLQLKLEGDDGMNRGAVGARVEVTAGGVTQTQEVRAGHGHYGMQHDMTLHFGLDSACSAKVTVHWPSGPRKVEHFEVDGNARYVVMQGGEAEREESTD